MGAVIKFPSHEQSIAARLKALLEMAEADGIIAFVYAFEDQDGEIVVDILGEIDEPPMLSAINMIRREIKKL